MYINLNGGSGDIIKREFYSSYKDAESRLKALEDVYKEKDDFYFDPKAIFRLDFRNTKELIEQLNLLNTTEGRKQLIQ